MAPPSKTPAEAVEDYRGRTVRPLSCLTSAHATVSGYQATDHPPRLLLARGDAARLHTESRLALAIGELSVEPLRDDWERLINEAAAR